MMIVILIFTLVVFTTVVAGQHLSVTDAVADRIDAQAWRVDRLTKQFQTISDLADGARAAAKEGGDTAGHLMNHYLKDEECPPNRRRCGKSLQCISVLAFCDGVIDCKNHYDENPERCVLPLPANSAWIGYKVYEHCNMGLPGQMTLHITSVPEGYGLKSYRSVKIQMTAFVMRGGTKRSVTGKGEGAYSMGQQALIIERQDRSSPAITFQFDGVHNDRFISSLRYQVSGIKCGEYHYFKQ